MGSPTMKVTRIVLTLLLSASFSSTRTRLKLFRGGKETGKVSAERGNVQSRIGAQIHVGKEQQFRGRRLERFSRRRRKRVRILKESKPQIGENRETSELNKNRTEVVNNEKKIESAILLENYNKTTIKEILEKKEKKVGTILLVNGRPAIVKKRIAGRKEKKTKQKQRRKVKLKRVKGHSARARKGRKS